MPGYRILLVTIALVLLCGAESPAQKYAEPRMFGLELPLGEVSYAAGARVLTKNDAGEPVAALLHAKVGPNFVAQMPDGQLVGRSATDALETDRPFEPISKEALATLLLVDKLANHKSKITKHYLFLYNTSEEFANVTASIMESMLVGMATFCKAQKLEISAPRVPLVVIMFRTEEEFQKYHKMPQGVLAYYHIVNNRVVLYEESKLLSLKKELALKESMATIAHEGAHQILANIGVQERLSVWPMWLTEGLAEYLAPTSVTRNLRWKGAGQVNDMRMMNLEVYLKAKDSSAPDGTFINYTVQTTRLGATGYASAWALTHYLGKMQSANFAAFLRECSRLRAFQGAVSQEYAAMQVLSFHKHFGDDLGALENQVVLHLKRQPYEHPFADERHYICKLQAPGLPGKRPIRQANIFHARWLAERWFAETVVTLPAGSRAGVIHEITEQENRAKAEQAARLFLAGR